MSLKSALISALAISASASSGHSIANSISSKHHKGVNRLAAAHNEAAETGLSLFAPKDWKNMKFAYVPPAATPTDATTTDANHRQLRQRPRNPTYKPSNSEVGYIILEIYNDHKDNGTIDPLCTDGNQVIQLGVSVGTCFSARKYHGDTIIGSWQVGVVEASSGRNHIHVESFASDDCTGPPRRTTNNLSRIHFDEGAAVTVNTNRRSRTNWGQSEDDHDGMFDFTCNKYHYYRGSSAPLGASCIADGHLQGHGIVPNCGNDEYIFYTIIPGLWGGCSNYGEQQACTSTAIEHRAYGVYDAQADTWTPDPTCTGTPAFTENVNLGCRQFTPQVSGDPPLPNADDDDDYEGGPEKEWYYDDNIGWNDTKSDNYQAFDNTIFNRSPEGSTIEGSTLYVYQNCWLGVRNNCGFTPN